MLPDKPWLFISEAQPWCSISHRTLQRYCESGKLPARKLPGGYWQIPRDALLKIIGQVGQPSV